MAWVRVCQSEWLSVELPWSTEALDRLRAARARRRNLWIGAVASLVGGLVTLVAMGRAGAAELPAYRLGALALLATLVVCVIGALVAEWRVGQASVAVDLDASRRWVTLRGVAPEFAQAVRARQSPSDQPYPAP